MITRTGTTVLTGLAVLAALPTAPAVARAQHADTGQQPLTSYSASLVPPGSTARVQWTSTAAAAGRTVVVLHVRGLVPNRAYGAHAHRLACGATGAAAGGHFQYRPDPVTPSVDAAFANPDNEIWLDLTTDSEGSGTAQAVVGWQFPNASGARAHSVVLHDHHTATADGVAGTAGPRLGCLTVSF